MKKWVTVATGYWRVYESKRLPPGFVYVPRYPSDNDFEARVQIVRRRRRK